MSQQSAIGADRLAGREGRGVPDVQSIAVGIGRPAVQETKGYSEFKYRPWARCGCFSRCWWSCSIICNGAFKVRFSTRSGGSSRGIPPRSDQDLRRAMIVGLR